MDKTSNKHIIPSFAIESEGDEPLVTALEKSRKKAIERGVWNIYESTKECYCFKTYFLGFSAANLGLGALWYATSPATFTSFFNKLVWKS